MCVHEKTKHKKQKKTNKTTKKTRSQKKSQLCWILAKLDQHHCVLTKQLKWLRCTSLSVALSVPFALLWWRHGYINTALEFLLHNRCCVDMEGSRKQHSWRVQVHRRMFIETVDFCGSFVAECPNKQTKTRDITWHKKKLLLVYRLKTPVAVPVFFVCFFLLQVYCRLFSHGTKHFHGSCQLAKSTV